MLECQKRVEEKLDNPSSYVLGTKKGEDTVGMVDACKFAGEKVNHIAKVLGVYVRKAYRGQGKGRELMEAFDEPTCFRSTN